MSSRSKRILKASVKKTDPVNDEMKDFLEAHPLIQARHARNSSRGLSPKSVVAVGSPLPVTDSREVLIESIPLQCPTNSVIGALSKSEVIIGEPPLQTTDCVTSVSVQIRAL